MLFSSSKTMRLEFNTAPHPVQVSAVPIGFYLAYIVPRGTLADIFEAVEKAVGTDILLKNLSDQGDLPKEI
ncbi:MAG TPA: hypothetical protein ENI07_06195 [Desulfobacterales bacterium]|nr:hypothetical protein [Desulfobacterales bacterium]